MLETKQNLEHWDEVGDYLLNLSYIFIFTAGSENKCKRLLKVERSNKHGSRPQECTRALVATA